MTTAETTNHAAAIVARVLIAPYLGHGRATECLLACFAGSYGTALLIWPELGWGSSALRAMFWRGEGQYVAIPLMTKAVLTGFGLLANIKDWPYERTLRWLGALLGTWIWIWFLLQFNHNSAPGAFGAFASFWFALFSFRIMGMAYLGYPIPGTTGRL